MDQNVTISADFLKQEDRKPRQGDEENRMRTLLLAAFGLILGTAAATAADKEVLRVEYEYADPGEEGIRWVETYYNDEQGRLSRIIRTTSGVFSDDHEVRSEVRFRWSESELRWFGDLWNGSARVLGDTVTLSSRQMETVYTFTESGDAFQWESSGMIGKWSARTGLDLRISTDETWPQVPFSGTLTRGALIVQTSGGVEQLRLIYAQFPDRLEASFYAPYESGTGWFTVGRSAFRGPGLWTASRTVRLLEFVFLDQTDLPPLWLPFLLKEHFLR